MERTPAPKHLHTPNLYTKFSAKQRIFALCGSRLGDIRGQAGAMREGNMPRTRPPRDGTKLAPIGRELDGRREEVDEGVGARVSVGEWAGRFGGKCKTSAILISAMEVKSDSTERNNCRLPEGWLRQRMKNAEGRRRGGESRVLVDE